MHDDEQVIGTPRNDQRMRLLSSVNRNGVRLIQRNVKTGHEVYVHIPWAMCHRVSNCLVDAFEARETGT